MYTEYKKEVLIIKDSGRSLDHRQLALRNLLTLYTAHKKKHSHEAVFYIKQSVLHLFRVGVLRGLTEGLGSLKLVWLDIMESVTNEEMEKMGLSPTDIVDFHKLMEKFRQSVNPANTRYQMYTQDTEDEIYDLLRERRSSEKRNLWISVA